MDIRINPGKLNGTVKAPPSKSELHRLLVSAALSDDTSVIRNLSESEDVMATMDCIRALGAETVFHEDGSLSIRGGVDPSASSAVFPCRESGSTLRFLLPVVFACGYHEAVFTGSERLFERGISVYENLLSKQGFSFTREKNNMNSDETENAFSSDIRDRLSLIIKGKLTPGVFELPGNVSSQFISGLLFALPLLQGDSEIRLTEPAESRPYIDLTIDTLRKAGIEVNFSGENRILIHGGQRYHAFTADAEGDWSNAAAILAFNETGSDIRVTGLSDNSLQGDLKCLDFFRELNASDPHIDLSDHPDLGSVLFALAALKNGGTFTGIRRLRLKESDRVQAMCEELAKFGVNCRVCENRVEIPGKCVRKPEMPLFSHQDHRIVMALTLLLAETGGAITHAESIVKSFPDYFEKIHMLGMKFTEENCE